MLLCLTLEDTWYVYFMVQDHTLEMGADWWLKKPVCKTLLLPTLYLVVLVLKKKYKSFYKT